MIDVESYIFNAVYDDVAPLCASGCFKSIHDPVPTKFPTATLYEMKNLTDYAKKSTAQDEDFATLTYEAHVYANTKAKCRTVFAALDAALIRMNMSRISGDYTPSADNTKVHEFVARYRVSVDRDGILYRKP